MAFQPGTKGVFKIGDDEVGTGTLRDISDALSEASTDESVDTDETTALGDTAKAYIATLEDGTISLDGHFTNDTNKVHKVLSAIKRKTVAFELYPHGETQDDPKAAGNCILTSYRVTSNVANRVTVSASLQVSGGVTWSTVA